MFLFRSFWPTYMCTTPTAEEINILVELPV